MDLLLYVDVGTPFSVTVSATSGKSAVSVSGSDTTGSYLQDFFGDNVLSDFVAGEFGTLDSSSDNDLTYFLETPTFAPQLWRVGNSDPGLNIYTKAVEFTADFIVGTQAYKGSATWTIADETLPFAVSSGQIIFPGDTVDDPGQVVGLWCIGNPTDGCIDTVPTTTGSPTCTPGTGGAYGDVHIRTLDGLYYDFQGIGQYVYHRTSDFLDWGMGIELGPWRDRPVSVLTGTSIVDELTGSAWEVGCDSAGALAFKVNGTALSVEVGQEYQMVNGISFTLSSATVVDLTWPGHMSATVSAHGSGDAKYMNLYHSIDARYVGEMEGLAGNVDCDPENDLTVGNVTLPATSSTEFIHDNFGTKWELPEENQYFADPFNAPPDYDPVFVLPEPECADDGFEEAARELCGESETCLFDAFVTCDLDVAEETMNIEEELEREVSTTTASPTTTMLQCTFEDDDGCATDELYTVTAFTQQDVDEWMLDGSLGRAEKRFIVRHDALQLYSTLAGESHLLLDLSSTPPGDTASPPQLYLVTATMRARSLEAGDFCTFRASIDSGATWTTAMPLTDMDDTRSSPDLDIFLEIPNTEGTFNLRLDLQLEASNKRDKCMLLDVAAVAKYGVTVA